jgi:hypothetical protein
LFDCPGDQIGIGPELNMAVEEEPEEDEPKH